MIERDEKKKGSETSPIERMMVHMTPKLGIASLRCPVSGVEEAMAEARGFADEAEPSGAATGIDAMLGK